MREVQGPQPSGTNSPLASEVWTRGWAGACFVIVGSVAFLVLLTWLTGRWQISALGRGYVPVAPSTAVSLLALSAAALLRQCRPDSLAVSRFGHVTGLGVLAMSLLVWVQYLFGFRLSVEQWLAHTTETVGQIPVGRMSPLTASAFLLAALAFLFQLPPWFRRRPLRQAAAILALAVLLLGLHMAMGYVVQVPVLYGGTFVPMAAATAVAFIVMGSGLLLATGTGAWPLSMLFPSAREAPSLRRYGVGLLALFLLFSVAVSTTGYFYFRQERARAHLLAEESLTAIADIKVNQITQWRSERANDAALLLADPQTAQRVRRYLAGPRTQEETGTLRAWLAAIQTNYAYRSVALLDGRCEVVLSAGEKGDLTGEHARKAARLAMETGRPVFSDLHRAPAAPYPHLDLVAPVSQEGNGGGGEGAVLMRVDPAAELYPMIMAWPTPSPSGETLLVRREGNQVLFLNELRFKKGTEMELMLPIDSPQLPAAKAAKGETGVLEGVDYRGAPVLSAFCSVPGSPWGLVAKVDMDEMEAPTKRLAGHVAAMVILLLISTGSASAFLWRQQEVRYLRMQLEGEAERKRAQDELARRAEDLARSNAELQQFAYVASHDLQEPLRVVASYVQLLSRRYKGKLDAEADEFIEFAVEGAKRMQQLINDLLNYSRVGTKGAAFVMVDSGEALGEALANLGVALSEAGAQVTRGELPAVQADPKQMVLLFQNLVSNAVKFRGTDPPRIHVEALSKEREWVFSVRDNGIGIEPRFFDRIFILFQRLHGQAEFPGTGIGLTICQKILQRHKGKIWVESSPGEGSTFYFTLPKG